ncbi:MAG: hypothetical protein EXS51_02805 [Candidatus Taylorbacteria bacterium]|nr:hypothetical protein [Candidatus Taylorbacteria bacterium]
MKKFIFIMQHAPTAEQITAASEGGREVVQVNDKKLLIVPDDANLGKEWFTNRAEEIVAAVGGISEGDTLHVMGQQQLAMAVSAIGRKAGAELVESVTPRVSKDIPQADGTVKKEFIFTFKGFRTVHQY